MIEDGENVLERGVALDIMTGRQDIAAAVRECVNQAIDLAVDVAG
jgi:hypothetical protein